MFANPNPPSGGYTPPATSPSTTNPSGAAQGGPGSGVFPAPQPAAPQVGTLEYLQGIANDLQQHLDDPSYEYNKTIADTWAQLQKLDPTDSLNTQTIASLNQIMSTAQTRKNGDITRLKAASDQISQELDRRQRAARDTGVLTPKEQAALDAQTALAKRQQEHIDAQMQQEAAASALANDPTNIKLAQDKSAADTAATKAQTAYQEAQNQYAGQSFQQALDSGAQKLEEGRRTLAAGGPEAGVSLTSAQANQAQATADATAQATREHQRGALGTFIDQVTATAAAGLITQAEAERQIAAFAQAQSTGATPYEWQQQADANARQVATSMIQSGQMVGPNQQYVAGGEPGGLLEQAAARWGFKLPAVALHPTGAPAYMQSLGMTTGTPQPQAQGGPAGGGAPAYMQSLTGAPPGGLPDYSHLSLAQIEAIHGPTPPAAAPAASGTASGPAGLPPGATVGGVNNGLLLGPIITGAPNYARLPGT